MLQALLNFILYIPRKIYFHFEDYKALKEENKQLAEEITNYKRICKRISYKCDDYMKQNQAVSYTGFQRIKELANTFPND